jgi:hypothetical protein
MNVDETVRAALHDPELALPGWPDAVNRVHAGIRRRHRRRRTVGLGVATAIMLALALPVGAKLSTAGRPQSPSSVPSPSPSGEMRAATTPCVSGQLSASLSPGPVTGESLVVMTNQGAGRCTLADWPVLVTTAAGQVQIVPVVQVPADAVGDEQVPATIDPGENAYATVVASLTCQGGQDPTNYTNLAVALDGGQVPLRGSQVVTTCPVQIGPWYRIVGRG